MSRGVPHIPLHVGTRIALAMSFAIDQAKHAMARKRMPPMKRKEERKPYAGGTGCRNGFTPSKCGKTLTELHMDAGFALGGVSYWAGNGQICQRARDLRRALRRGRAAQIQSKIESLNGTIGRVRKAAGQTITTKADASGAATRIG